jgi:hypothetical protein
MTHLHPDDRASREPEPAYVPEHASALDKLTDHVTQVVLDDLRRHLTEYVIVELQLREHLVYRRHPADRWQRVSWALVGAAAALLLMLALLFSVWGIS